MGELGLDVCAFAEKLQQSTTSKISFCAILITSTAYSEYIRLDSRPPEIEAGNDPLSFCWPELPIPQANRFLSKRFPVSLELWRAPGSGDSATCRFGLPSVGNSSPVSGNLATRARGCLNPSDSVRVEQDCGHAVELLPA